MSTDGKIQIQADIVPTNLNPRMFITDNKYVKGAPQVFKTITEMVAFHPARMTAGMPATILNYPKAGVITDFRLIAEPSSMVDENNNSIVTEDNFSQFWQVQNTLETAKTRVYQYSADGPGGGSPVYPYVPGEESKWSNTFDATKGHRWMRFRDDDVDANEDGIYDNWTVPISINNIYASGDFIENRFKRQAVSSVQHTGTGTLQVDKYYIIDTGQVRIQGDLSLNDIGAFGTITDTTLGTGRRFKYAAANTYTFLNSAVVTETVPAPPRTINGLPNNEPAGWSDTIPVGTDQLWQITAQKSVYNQLKSEWIIKKIVEDPNYIRYSNKPTPHPDTIAGVNTPATSGSPGDVALIAEGWASVYDNHSFIATRQDDPGADLYTNWLVEKINEESGEYTDRVFKLFDLNLDADSPFLVAPTLRDPTKEGWSDSILQETDTQINYVSEARKFFNGELKTPWSKPRPYTGKDTFSDIIESDLGDNFKYDQHGNVMPDKITLKGLLYKGTSELWQNADVTITYVWKKVYDGGQVVDVSPSSNPADDFYLLGENGSPGDADYAREDQRVVIKPGAVHGDAVFRCTQTVTLPQGGDLVFEDEFSILDVTDGKDARLLVVSADIDRVIWDSVNTVFNPASIILRVYSSNIPSPTYYWYRWTGAAWAAITSGVGGYTITGNVLTTASSNVFTGDDSSQEQRYAVSTHSTNPDSADFENTFSDYITVVKLASAGVGSSGADSLTGILSNEAHTILLNSTTGLPVSGEITSSGKAKTTLQVYEGLTKLVYGGANDYTIGVASDNGNVTFAFAANGNDVDIYVDTWAANERSAVCTITITYGTIVFSKKFSISSSKDAPGAVLLDIDSDKGFTFTPADKSNKTLTAKLFDTALTGTQEIPLPDATHTFRWNVAGVWSSQSSDNTRTITRSDILVTAQVTVEVYRNGVLFRSRTITIADVNDGKSYRAWSDNATKPSAAQVLSNQDPTNAGIWPVTVNGIVWRLPTDSHWQNNLPVWAQDAEENAGSFVWRALYQLKGEKGDQGNSGNFLFDMYIAFDPETQTGRPGPPNPPPYDANGDGIPDLFSSSASLVQMQSYGWLARPPATGVIWRTSRLWIGQGVSFDGSGNPSTNPVTGSLWTPPVRLSGKDGVGTPGTNGLNGWSPTWAIVPGANAGEKVLQLTGWLGGSGPDPGHVGQYIGASGFTDNIALAQPVTGEPVEMRHNSSTGFLQWKYVGEDAIQWRNLFKPAISFSNGGLIAGNWGVNFLFANQLNTTSSRQYSGGSWTNTTGVAVTIKVTAMTLAMRDSGGSDRVSFTVFTSISGTETYVSVSFILDGTSWATLIVPTYRSVPAGATVSWRASMLNTAGGECYMQPEAKFDVEIVGQ